MRLEGAWQFRPIEVVLLEDEVGNEIFPDFVNFSGNRTRFGCLDTRV